MIENLWYKNTIIYSLDLETFQDSDGDGVGDFEGLMRRLDYLHWLGIDTIWVAPFQVTPNRDNGYDISDFYGVDPRHGSGGDFVEFMHQAKQRGMKVIIDLVANHTSDRHPWFQQARSDPESRFRDWYIWSKKRPADWNKGMVFPGVQDRTWTYDKEAKAYYYHRFYNHQPDLNMDHPQVRTEIRRIIGYWLELGVKGFRVDAVPFLIETTTPGKEQGDLRFDYLAEFRDFLQWREGDGILLGEANVLPKEAAAYFGSHGQGLHMMFNFYVNQYAFYALATGDTRPLAQALKASPKLPPTAQWAHFLRNHDELDLGRLKDEERARVFEQFGPEERMQLYGRGIRRRLAPMLGDRRHLELAYSLLLSLPGTPVLRYGDEIGMGDDLRLTERDAVRTPMQWSADENAGFSTGGKTIHPVIADGVWSYERVNVEAQRTDPASLLNWTARMIALRRECPEIGLGDWALLSTGRPGVLAIRYDWHNNAIIAMHNFRQKPTEAKLRLRAGDVDDRLADLRSGETLEPVDGGVHRVALEAYGYRWFRVGGFNRQLFRERG